MTLTVEGGSSGRLLTIVFAAAAAFLVALRLEPRIAAEQRSVSDAEFLLRSDEIAFADEPLLRAERRTLRNELGALLSGPPEAAFVHELARVARRRHVRVLSTSFQRSPAQRMPQPSGTDLRLEHHSGSLALEGAYTNLLEAIADLSRGEALVAVGAPSIQRTPTSLVAQIPVTLSELPRDTRR